VGGVTLNAETNFTFDGTNVNINGNLGVNAGSPTEKIQVNDGSIFINGENGGLIVDAGNSKRIGLIKYSGHEAYLSRTTGQDFGIVRTTGSTITDGANLISDLYINSTGLVGINNAGPLYRMDISGDIRVLSGALGVNVNPSATDGRIDAGNDVIAYSSDRRLKTNIEFIENPLEKVLKLSGFTYNWNELAKDVAKFNTEERLVGVFAQDVKDVLPEAVKLAPFDNDGTDKSKSGEEYLTVQYEKMVPLLIESIRELTKKIEDLENIVKKHNL